MGMNQLINIKDVMRTITKSKNYKPFLAQYYGITTFFDGMLFLLHYTTLIIADLFNPMAVTVLFITYNITQVVLEIPTGSWADRFGRKNVLLLGQLLCVLGFSIISFNHSFTAFLVFEILFGIQSALFSGAIEALVYDNMKYYGIDKNFSVYRNYAESFTLAGFACSAFLSGIIVKFYGYEPLYWLQVISYAVVLLLLLCMQDHGAHDSNIRKLNDNYWKILRWSLQYLGKNISALKSLLFGALYWSIWIIFLIFQPLLFAELLHNQNTELVGIMIALQCLLTALGKILLMRYCKQRNLTTAMWLFLISGICLCLCMYYYSLPLSFIFWIIFWICSYVPYAIASNMEHLLIPSRLRATLLSVKGFLNSLIKSGYLLIFGLLGKAYNYQVSFRVMGLIYLLIICSFYLLVLTDKHIRTKQHRNEQQAKV